MVIEITDNELPHTNNSRTETYLSLVLSQKYDSKNIYLYGQSGVGKTFLIKKVLEELNNHKGNINTLYFTAQNWICNLVSALENNRLTEFRQRLHNVDYIIFDDLEFFVFKERSQEELLYWINQAKEQGTQVITCSTQHWFNGAGFNLKLRNRLVSGYLLELGYPSYKEKLYVVRSFCTAHNLVLKSEVERSICEDEDVNFHGLMGLLSTALATHKSCTKLINLNSRKDLLKNTTLIANLTIESKIFY